MYPTRTNRRLQLRGPRFWEDSGGHDVGAMAAAVVAGIRPYTWAHALNRVPVTPAALPTSMYRRVHRVGRRVVQVAVAMAQRVASTPPHLAELLGRDPGDLPALPTHWLPAAREVISSRPDCIIRRSVPHVVELNCHSAVGGVNLVERLTEIFCRPTGSERRAADAPTAYSPFEARLRMLLAACRFGGGPPAIVTIGLLADPDVAGPAFFTDEVAFQRGRDVDASFVSVETLQEKGLGPLAGKSAVLRVGIVADWIDAAPDVLAALGADVATPEGLARLVVSDTAELLEDKALLALLSEGPALTAAEREVTRRHLPWTRLLRDGAATTPGGERVDLLGYVLRERESLVLKPCSGRQSAGVRFGRRSTTGQWEEALDVALRLGERWIVQHVVDGDPLPVAYVDTLSGELTAADRTHVISPYLFGAADGGCLARFLPDGDELTIAGRHGAVQNVAIGV